MVRLVLVVLVSAVAGAVNSFAGGGTLLTFPALIGLGIPPIVANATSTVALWPATLGSMWGYRRELEGARAWAVRFAIPSLVGGLAGALLLLRTPASTFSALVPWLVLGATALFLAQRPMLRLARRWRERGGAPADDASSLAPSPGGVPTGTAAARLAPPSAALLLIQLGVAVYGGYFGAGIGILMLAALGFMGLTNIHRMNGLKNWGGLCINAVAAVTFAASGLVNWPVAACMAVGATLGGYAGAGLAQRFAQESVRKAVAAVGLASGIWLAVERF
jgi:uncharacterized membrane protein YfcA